jgi:Rps23 Pro-64 3,4-dihydroxylase Tpa1-like proline 4-hydroxylase
MITALAATLDFSRFEVSSEPFPYAVSPRVFNNELSSDILSWLETEAPWRLVETDFYEQFEFDFLDADPPSHLRFLQDQIFRDALRSEVQKLFGVRLGGRVDLTAHKLVEGQRIRIHNDYIPGGETHRLLIQLNRGWRDEDGGLLMFFNSPDPSDVHKIFRPVHDSAVAFTISSDSHHAVTTIHGCGRFTLVFSFYAEK